MYEDSAPKIPPKRRTPPILVFLAICSSINRANACNSDSAVLVSSPWWVGQGQPGSVRCHRVFQTQALLLQTFLEMEGVHWGDQNGKKIRTMNEDQVTMYQMLFKPMPMVLEIMTFIERHVSPWNSITASATDSRCNTASHGAVKAVTSKTHQTS